MAQSRQVRRERNREAPGRVGHPGREGRRVCQDRKVPGEGEQGGTVGEGDPALLQRLRPLGARV